MKSCLDLDDRTNSSFCGNDFDLDKERELNERLSSWYGQEKLLIESKSDARKVIGSLKPLFEDKKIKIIVIGGTNGKGETSHRLDSLLRREGLRTALWTSPHVLSLRERFLWQGEQVTYEDLNESLDEGRRLCQKNGWSLSYYEFLFFVYCQLTLKLEKSKGLDVIILEVGLGGRLDAVNFLGPDLTAICSLSRDHQGILGNTLTEILKEKLGISRENVPLITGLELSYLQSKTHMYCLEGGIPHFDLFKRGFLKKSDSYVFRNKVLAYLLKEIFLLERKVPIEDFLNPLEVRKKVADQGFPNFRGSKGRFEVWPFNHNDELLFVGAHNIDGIRKLTEVLKDSVFNHVLLSFSKRDQKDILASLSHLASYPCLYKNISLTFFDHEKAWRGEKGRNTERDNQILKLCDSLNIQVLSDWQQWLEISREKKNKVEETEVQRTLITGSYYFIGEVQKFLLSKR